ncbi:hypothetical protein HDU86_004977 [Geranomyces michiganensis]|nr:hypothetical protein HDU86_004977 [Geranomyces michiganensis]
MAASSASPPAGGGHALLSSSAHHGPSTLPDHVLPCLPHRVHPVYNKYHFAQCAGSLPALSSALGGMASAGTDSAGSRDTATSRLEHDLIRAITANAEERVCELLDAEPELAPENLLNNISPATGLAPLHYAAARGFLGIFRQLQDRGAQVELPDKEGETSLLKAAYGGHTDVLRHILATRPNVNHKDRDGWSALHNCSSGGHLAAAQAIIDAGGDVNIKSNTGHTPLMSASAKGFADLVELLLRHNADPLAKNNFDDAAYDLAAQAEEQYICDILQRAEQDALKKQDWGSVSRFRIDELPAATDAQTLESIRSEAEAYQTSIQQLLAGIKDDMDGARKRAASVLVASYLERAEELNALIDTLEGSDGCLTRGENESQAQCDGEGFATSSRGPPSALSTAPSQTFDSGGGSRLLRTSAQDSASLHAIPINPMAAVDDSVPLSMSPPSSWQPDDDAPPVCQRQLDPEIMTEGEIEEHVRIVSLDLVPSCNPMHNTVAHTQETELHGSIASVYITNIASKRGLPTCNMESERAQFISNSCITSTSHEGLAGALDVDFNLE